MASELNYSNKKKVLDPKIWKDINLPKDTC